MGEKWWEFCRCLCVFHEKCYARLEIFNASITKQRRVKGLVMDSVNWKPEFWFGQIEQLIFFVNFQNFGHFWWYFKMWYTESSEERWNIASKMITKYWENIKKNRVQFAVNTFFGLDVASVNRIHHYEG